MFAHALNTISVYSVFLPVVAGVFSYSNFKANARALLLVLAFASIPHIAIIVNKTGSLPVIFYNCYILAEALLWPLVFLLTYELRSIKRILILLWCLNFLVPLGYIAYTGFSTVFHNKLVCVNSFLQITYIILFFYEINQRHDFIILKKEPMFWFSIGLLFYSTCTFFLFLYFEKINSYMSKSELNVLWGIHDFFNTLMYVFFTVGFLTRNSKKNVQF